MSAEDRNIGNHRELFGLLYETAVNAGIEVIEDRINRKGGVCRLQERLVVVYDAQAPFHERNRLILDAISQVNRDHLYLPPRVRRLLEEDDS
ncbi:MAG: hypothetical protein BWZ01_01589 [Deltaproteobacteria bacterium ADurb.BinA179]|jgi:hypothetical protein|nr:MAG: hypothetical protein BWZ01_01589 [Deltaproteobacteria bacterium ADurb.BinA179]HOS27823.1 hypothetical protein [Deltaproteobacteria bacterium]HPV30245.1 hypothetical protein [Deltaproteobacteria bacterium]HQM20126.1 hypothetical protein [Deltaproteobacteria bacterium]